MGDQRLSSPRLTVIREGHDPITLQTTNIDLVLWDRTRVKHKWPRLDEAPFLWFTFISWSAARRTGAIPTDYLYDRWEAEVLDVEADTPEDHEDDLGNPFRVVPDPD